MLEDSGRRAAGSERALYSRSVRERCSSRKKKKKKGKDIPIPGHGGP
jgi:hypothetical protein